MTRNKLWISMSLVGLLACGRGEGESDGEQVRGVQGGLAAAREGLQQVSEQRIRMAVSMVRSNLDSLQGGGGYQAWTASKAASRLAAMMNTSQEALPGEPALPTSGPNLRYVVGKATGPFQIALIPDDEAKKLRVEGYGRDAATPVHTEEFAVSMY